MPPLLCPREAGNRLVCMHPAMMDPVTRKKSETDLKNVHSWIRDMFCINNCKVMPSKMYIYTNGNLSVAVPVYN